MVSLRFGKNLNQGVREERSQETGWLGYVPDGSHLGMEERKRRAICNIPSF